MIPLSLRSHYSLMWGTTGLKALCRCAADLGYSRIALTDTDNLYGMWPFIQECRHHGLTPVIGADITDPDTRSRAVCLVKNSEGFSSLTRLITQRHCNPDFSLKKDLPLFSNGLMVLTRDAAFLADWHEHGMDLAANLAQTPLSARHILCATARKRNLPLVATPDNYFLYPGDTGLHQMLRAIDRNTSLSRLKHSDTALPNAFFPAPAIFEKRFGMLPEALTNSRMIAEKIEFTGPDFGIVMPPLTDEPTGEPADRLLYKKAMAGARKRYGQNIPAAVTRRIDHELAIIRQKGFCQYFLVVQRIVQRASRICGRGSGAASIVAYCLGITNVCPIKHNLYFERFLNPDRKDPPDIDIDFAWDERDAILNWVLDRFRGHAAMVSSHILFQPRMAVREVARVFGLPENEISRISKRLPWFWKRNEASQSLLDRIRKRPEFRFMDFPEPWPRIMQYAQAVVGTPRHLSVHPGGMVITPRPIDTYVPVENAPKGVPIIQWEKDGTETAGLVKIDLLGNRSLGVIRDAIEMASAPGGRFDDFQHMDPEDDYDTQINVAQGNTMGCFYIESPATRLLQKKSKVGDFDHVVIHSSIIRPAANEFIQEYIKRLHTGIWDPIHPLLADVLEETYGIMVFQEDVSRVAVRMAGFTHAQADGLRKIMSKKDKERALADYYNRFRDGALKNHVTSQDIDRVWDMITSFSGYSFCKPHSASYARVSFQAAYLKTHYPAEFMAAVISNQGGFYSTFAYVSEARRMGVTIRQPDVNTSGIHWKGQKGALRVGLMAVKHLSASTMNTIMQQREFLPFKNPDDFFTRVKPKEDEARALIHSGSLDSLAPDLHRAQLLWAFVSWRHRKKQAQDLTGLFEADQTQMPMPELPRPETADELKREFSILGFLCRHHPMVLFPALSSHPDTIRARDIPKHTNREITFAGWLITGKSVQTRKGDPMKFITFEDDTGLIETVFFPKAYARFCHMLDYGRPYLVKGRPEESWGAVTVTVHAVHPA